LLLRLLFRGRRHALAGSISLLEIEAHLDVSELLNVILRIRKVRQALVVGASVDSNNFPVNEPQALEVIENLR